MIPVALFTYARPDHLRRTLSCLRDNAVPLIYAFSDAPRTPEKAPLVAQVRTILRGIDWCEVVLTEREENWGLGRSILAGVTTVLDRHAACLVFEDDLISVPGSYAYLCAALRQYRDDMRVMSVSAWTHPLITPDDVGDQPYFDGRADCWGWGTWARAWQGMNDQTAREMMLVAEARGIDRNRYGTDLPAMAETELQRNIWAVRWLYHHLAQGGLCLRPPWSLVENIGFDAQATNTSGAGPWHNPPLRPCPPVPDRWPVPVEHPACASRHRRAMSASAPPPGTWLTRQVSRLQRGLRRAAVQIMGHEALQTLTPKELARLWTPPIAILGAKALQRRWVSRKPAGKDETVRALLGLVGDYATWADAQAASGGYDTEVILQKTLDALRQVKRGDAVYERDSVLFDTVEYAWPVLAGLMWVAAQRGGRLNVLDVGGSLGSTYFQNRAFLHGLAAVRWNIVEQSRHVEVGQREFQDERLRFYDSLETCLADTMPDVILLSSVLQYLEDPYDLLDKLKDSPCRSLIIDRTPFWAGSSDRLCVQHVPASIYAASYPSWIFSTPRFHAILSLHWELVAEFASLDSLPGPVPMGYRGLIAVRRDAPLEPLAGSL